MNYNALVLTFEALCRHPEETPSVKSQTLCRSSFHLAVSFGCMSIFYASP